MSNQLFLELPARLEGGEPETLNWLVWDVETSQVRDRGCVSVEQLSALADQFSALPCYALVPGELVSRHQIVLPKGGRVGLSALPFQLEERLCSDLSGVHFAHSVIKPNQSTDVLVVERELMAAWHQLLLNSGLKVKALYPDYGAIAENIVVLDQHRAISHSVSAAAAMQAKNFPVWAKLAGGVEEMSAYTCCEASAEVVLKENLPSQNVFSVAQRLDAIAANFSPWLPNLLSAEFALRDEQSALVKALRWPVILLLALLFGHWLNLGLAIAAQNKEITQLESAIDQVYLDTFPGARVVNARSQMRSKLNALEQGGSDSSFLPWLETIALASGGGQSIRFSQLNFAATPGEIRLSLSAPSYEAVDTWVAKLQAKGLTVERGAFAAEAGGSNRVSGQISVKGGR
ncbi:hypothetical protein IB286_05980 [Spongiibacter sp. KMU-158]|uniref:Type II secretion system protein L n=1 Tax=Spongiibacter pelagi TaxID=2760804 RepID=A0A927BZP0_9GAMM|nr:type II secretion system protein GspL [Spongiibacter pelagi]MBD2858554.1 hypothetical protein [Spongiibacter pelagi]